MVLPTKVVKIQKNGTIWPIKHTFVWCIIYEQCVANVNVKIHNKKKVQGFYEKLTCQIYLVGNAKFASKTLDQTFLNDWWKFVFHAKLDLNINKYDDARL